MSQKSKGSILPPRYFEIFDGDKIRLLMGPFRKVVFRFGGRLAKGIKIIPDDYLTGQDTICYDYTIIDPAGRTKGIFDNTPTFSRIVGAVAIEILEQELENGATLEEVIPF